MPFTFVFPTILEPGVVSLPAREIYDVLVPRPLPALVLFDFQKEKESHVGLQAMSTIQKKKRFRARIKHYFTENVEFLE